MADCPYSCVDGYVYDPYKHIKIVCPHCLGEKRSKVRSGEVVNELKLPPSLTNGNFVPDAVIVNTELGALEAESVTLVLDKMKTLIKDVSIGILPDESILFNLGRKVIDSNFIAPFLTKAYSSGLSVLPLLSTIDIIKSRHNIDTDNSERPSNIVSYDDITSKKVCLVVIDAGSTNEEILAVKGVMQLRARYNLPTIIITHVWNYTVHSLYGDNLSKRYDIATLYQVKYKQRSKNINLGVVS